ncbi:MAG TPA: hypothetical protein VFQ44_04755 [Streptosporangiaceae bacterium]|nr:hypothetical protein [Streptosporangiaceae bacterium]
MPAGMHTPDEAGQVSGQISGQVPLGFDAAWGFAGLDQTSPARAAAAGALVDVSLADQPVTELRIHGVSGSNGPIMLEHPTALQVGGDQVAGFFRRWNPGGQGSASTVPWKLEAYSWGGLTEAPLASASWLLLAPFMMYNVAFFMLPPERPANGEAGPGQAGRGAGHWAAQALLRLLALTATIQLVASAATVMVSTAAWQAGRKGLLPAWMGWYANRPTGWRMAIALVGVVAVVALLWAISVATATRYEARTTTARPGRHNVWPLAEPGFWRGEKLVRRQRSLHSAAGCATAALIVALPAERLAALRDVAIGLAAAVLAAATVLILAPMADRHVHLRRTDTAAAGRRAELGCRLTVAAAAVAIVAAGLAAGLSDGVDGARRGPLPGLTGLTLVLIIIQLALLAALALTVTRLATVAARNAGGARDRRADRAFLPYLGGGLTVVFATFAFCLGWQFTVLLNLGVAKLLGTPVPGGFKFAVTTPRVFEVPWPVFASGAGTIGLVAGVIVAAMLLGATYLRLRARIEADQTGSISISDAYAGRGGQEVGPRGRRKIAGVWAVAGLAENITLPVLLVVGFWLIAVIAAEVIFGRVAGTSARPHMLTGSSWLHGAVSLVVVAGVLTELSFMIVLRSAIRSPSDRRIIGALWDVATFWPRAVHPLAPPCYAERAVPEVVDRIRLITGSADLAPDDPVRLLRHAEQPDLPMSPGLTVPAGPVLVTGYSQGAVIAIAVIAQLPEDAADQVALLTLACPARRLYGRAFPAYFGPAQLSQLSESLAGPAGQPGYRWRNMVRRSDYIGSWVFRDPFDRLADPGHDRQRWLGEQVDQPCWDPVVLVPDADPTPPPVHRHSAWWQDPRAGQVGHLLVTRLTTGRPAAGTVSRPERADRPWRRRPR